MGVIHLSPLLGYRNFPGFETALRNALADLRAFEKGGVDGVIFENNYDIPHKPFVDAPVIAAMALLGEKIKTATKLPVGVNVLWNDYYASLSLAKLLNLQFIRVPVFVDKVKTDYGVIEGNPQEITKLRKSFNIPNVGLFTDIHVKHSKILSKHNIATSAKLAVRNGADAVVVTGRWTGEVPDLEKLKSVRDAVGDFPILVGSGADAGNIKVLCRYANGVIVSTSLKSGGRQKNETNVKSHQQRIDIRKVKKLLSYLYARSSES